MQQPQPTTEPKQKSEKKQKVLIFVFSLILVAAIVILYFQKSHGPLTAEETLADGLQNETAQANDEIQTSIEDYCATDLEKFCKDQTGTKAFTCLKQAVAKLESSCRDFIKGEQ